VNGQPVSQFDLDLAHASGHVLAGYGFATVVGGYSQAFRASPILGNNPRNYLNEALRQQGLKSAPNNLKHTWTSDGFKYEVRIHAGNSQYTSAQSVYRVSRQQIPTPGAQGTGTSYLGTDGRWYHTSVLRQFNGDSTINALYNGNAARITHISLP